MTGFIPTGMKVYRCKYCDGHISYLYLPNGTTMAFDASPVETGHERVEKDGWLPIMKTIHGRPRLAVVPWRTSSATRRMAAQRVMLRHDCVEFRTLYDAAFRAS